MYMDYVLTILKMQSGTHYSAECKILSASRIIPDGRTLDYAGIELLRYLLLRDTDSAKWAKIQAFEPHTEERRNTDFTNKLTTLLIEFVRKCSLFDYSDEEIDHAIGVISIDTFWAYSSTSRLNYKNKISSYNPNNLIKS